MPIDFTFCYVFGIATVALMGLSTVTERHSYKTFPHNHIVTYEVLMVNKAWMQEESNFMRRVCTCQASEYEVFETGFGD